MRPKNTTVLNPRQLLFARSVLAGMSLTAAYHAAGYTGQGQVAYTGASKLMDKPAIAEFIEAHQQQTTVKTIADRREIIARYTRVLRADAEALQNDPPVEEVVRRTIVKDDGTRFTHVRTRTISRHTAIKHLTRLLTVKKTGNSRDAAYEEHVRADHELARNQVRDACAALPEPSEPAPEDSSEQPPASPDSPIPWHDADTLAKLTRIGRHLNLRQRRFCEFLSQDIPVSRAYSYAGYPGGSAAANESSAHRLLRRPAVVHYLRELHRHSLAGDPARELATCEELQTYLTAAARATQPELETQARFMDQVITDAVEKPCGATETRITVRSINTPRAMAQLLLLSPGQQPALPADNDPEFRLLQAAWDAMEPQPTLPSEEDRAAM
jgi:phage terminase small subunit